MKDAAGEAGSTAGDVPEETLPWEHWRKPWHYVSARIAPIELAFKTEHEDFEVEEQLSFEPSGEGEHLFLFLEKRGRSTPDLARSLARSFQVESKDVGWAGRKDTRGVTRQWFSVRGAPSADLERLEAPDCKLLRHTRNDRKLRLGALTGNRFRLLLRGIPDERRTDAESVLALVREQGLPNYFAAQRFGVSGRAPELGLLLLQGRARQYLLRRLHPDHSPLSEATGQLLEVIARGKRPEQRKLTEWMGELPREFAPLAAQLARRPGDWRSALRALDRGTLSLHLSAWQAGVFNAVLSERFAGRKQPLSGDLLQLNGSHSLFEANEAEDLRELETRCAAFELALTGPLPGQRAPLATGLGGQIERNCMERAGLVAERFELPVKGLHLPGARRALVVPVPTLQWTWEADGLRLEFALPPGAYATTLVAELTKNP